jgi:hypothetical protein
LFLFFGFHKLQIKTNSNNEIEEGKIEARERELREGEEEGLGLC